MRASWTMTLLLSALAVSGCRSEHPKVLPGADLLLSEYAHLVRGKRVGLITNQTGVTSDGRHLADLLHAREDVQLVALFGPEHGIRGSAEAGASVQNGRDTRTGVPIYSLYGRTKKPTPEMLENVDVLIFDIQDVGTRFYTYISTMSLAMEAAAERGIPFVVLDRPNPIGGEIVEGPVLEPELRSFVGIHPIALRHGMTVGELARMFAGEGWLAGGLKPQLAVVPMRGWKRGMLHSDTGLRWIRPSPNMPSDTTALLYPGMGLLEATNVSEGRGTRHPFQNIGAPWLDPQVLLRHLKPESFGVACREMNFVPVDIPGVATNPKYEGKTCRGIWLDVTQPRTFRSVEFGLKLLCALRTAHPDSFRIRKRGMELLTGSRQLTRALLEGRSLEELRELQNRGLEEFLKRRKRYLLY